MTSDNFYIYTDSEGHMPVLTRTKAPHKGVFITSHKYYTHYIDNAPVEVRPYPLQVTVWNYKIQEPVSISSIPSLSFS